MMEVYDAISKGVIDGEASNFETLFAFKFAEVVKYTTSVWADQQSLSLLSGDEQEQL